ncbi:hypothetical protein RhiirA1_468544 [Rhizophagus irregularis]|uniref:Uncharacterized protein n=1 Tax=Rhizophagus irregularis TaxID=588596 RepID=A0A2N0R9V4_9GLOM|nr:hypothetical protein RhiirA1_468544 [Rhizophagus irregularis]CAB4496244.1 unnamed protein product [Rhizophagus irregularis]CAB5217414.1 unnamed protein product [Rhizophagus irregularis]
MSVYPGQDTLISYLKKQSNKSYRGFLKLHHDIIMNSLTSDLKWYNLDNAWASNYIREAKKIFVDQQVIETLKKRINIERLEYKKELQAYWQRVIKEYEKENLVPKKKSHSKDTIKVLTKDLSETSQVNCNKRNNNDTEYLLELKKKQNQNENYMTKQDEYPETSKVNQEEINKSTKRNNDSDIDNLFIELKKKQKQNDDHIKIAEDILHIALAYEDLISGNITRFTELLKETLLTRSRMSLTSANESVLQVTVELLLPSKYRVPELCLIMNAAMSKGNGRFGFLDVFVLGESYISIELKYIPLTGLVSNINGKQTKDFNANKSPSFMGSCEIYNKEKMLFQHFISIYEKNC